MVFRRQWAVFLFIIALSSFLASPVFSVEPRDPFVDPRTIVIPETVRPKLMGVMSGPPDFVIIGEAVAKVGDTVDGWKVAQVLADGAVFQHGEQQKTLHIGELLPAPPQ